MSCWACRTTSRCRVLTSWHGSGIYGNEHRLRRTFMNEVVNISDKHMTHVVLSVLDCWTCIVDHKKSTIPSQHCNLYSVFHFNSTKRLESVDCVSLSTRVLNLSIRPQHTSKSTPASFGQLSRTNTRSVILSFDLTDFSHFTTVTTEQRECRIVSVACKCFTCETVTSRVDGSVWLVVHQDRAFSASVIKKYLRLRSQSHSPHTHTIVGLMIVHNSTI